MERLRIWVNTGLAAALFVGGAAILAFMVFTRPQPTQVARVDHGATVRTVTMVAGTFSEPIVGYGTVRPRRQVHITPQVSGVLTQVSEKLAVGQRLHKGELLFQIDPASYESQVAQLQANIRRIEANLAGLAEERSGLSNRLETARQQLELALKNYDSEQKLMEEKATRGLELDQSLERYLQRKEVVLTYESQAAMIPHKIAESQGQLDVFNAQLEEAQRNVERTRITAPFEARVESIGAQLSQAVTAYFSIATLTDLEVFEVPVVIDPEELIWTDRLIRAKTLGHDLGTPPSVKVTWSGLGSEVSWSGQVSRLERHDEATRTDRLVVEVPNPELDRAEGIRLLERGISQGMFVSAELPAEPLHEALVLPRHAIQENRFVYVFEPKDGNPEATEGALGIRQVAMLRSVGDNVVVHFSISDALGDGVQNESLESFADKLAACELRAGDQIILSNLPKPVVGMRVQRIQPDIVAFGYSPAADTIVSDQAKIPVFHAMAFMETGLGIENR